MLIVLLIGLFIIVAFAILILIMDKKQKEALASLSSPNTEEVYGVSGIRSADLAADTIVRQKKAAEIHERAAAILAELKKDPDFIAVMAELTDRLLIEAIKSKEQS